MQLSKILACGTGFNCNGDTSVAISGITCDSREVQKGFIFAALKGAKVNGEEFIAKAVEAGAVAILAAPDAAIPDNVVAIRHENPRLALSKMAAKFYGKQPETMVAVTGTNGKTSVAHFCQQLWQLLEVNAASFGTIGVVLNPKDNVNPFIKKNGASLTTPDSVSLHKLLADLKEYGIEHAAMEASSHGLDQYRLHGVKLKAAAFTNLSRDHLDYHETFEAYLAAKMKLFTELLPEGAPAILNADIPEYEHIVALCKQHNHPIVSYGYKAKDFFLRGVTPQADGQMLMFIYNEVLYKVQLPLVGEFQAYNVLCAVALLAATGVDVDAVIGKLPMLRSVPGRMEQVGVHPKGAGVYVDYAHTPDALEKALSSLRPHVSGKLYVVVGCGGDRDKGKRPQMGKIASDLADKVIITDDNPRTEDAATIRKEVLEGCDSNAKEIGDRKKAIDYAVSKLKKGDALLIAGKGHETTQIIGNEVHAFDDTLVAFEAISGLKEMI